MLKHIRFIFSPWMMGLLFVVFAVAMALATFIENEYGAQAARQLVYNTKWFELIFVLLVVNFAGQIFRYKLHKPRKLTILVFHLAFVVIILGAGITRYFGYEGILHLEEGQTKSTFQTQQKYLQLVVKGEEGQRVYGHDQKFVITSVSSDDFDRHFQVGGQTYRLTYQGYLPGARQTLVEVPDGQPMVQVTASRGRGNMRSFVLSTDEQFSYKGLQVGFTESDSLDVHFDYHRDSFSITAGSKISRFSMESRRSETFRAGRELPLQPMYIYKVKDWRLVVRKLTSSGAVRARSAGRSSQGHNQRYALKFKLEGAGSPKKIYVWGDQQGSRPAVRNLGQYQIRLDYGRKKRALPFQIRLDDFILERYPGSSSPSSYKSRVTLMDPDQGVNRSHQIYMNHILKYQGYRFYQSSYDQDEKGSVLSVNHDPVGMHVTYAGYGLLFVFVLLALVNRYSMFRVVKATHWRGPVKKGAGVLLMLLVFSCGTLAGQQNRPGNNGKLVVDRELARRFGKVLVQDRQGRTEPLYTLSHDILRKVHRTNDFKGLSSMQVFLGLHFDYRQWKDVPLIRVSHSGIRDIIDVEGKYAAISDLVDMQGNTYRLRKYVQKAYNKPAGERNKFEKEVIKVDERVNICFMVISGELFKIFPTGDSTHKWAKPGKAASLVANPKDSVFVNQVMGRFRRAVMQSNEAAARGHVRSIRDYQRQHAGYALPSEDKIEAEVLYYRSRVFERLFPFYAGLGLIMLIILMMDILSGKRRWPGVLNGLTLILAMGFVVHTGGYILRWYISGHAPMSNGYESMIFVSWVILLGGFLFARRSKMTLAATAILAALTLMVAHLSFMDPQITNLMPVLRSYWLTLHVSVITSSYGFLGMGAILGLIILILYAVVSPSRHDRIIDKICELTVINYKALTIGLYLLTIGTFLGAIWANESWGRYWGWDPKETWSLITIIVYGFVIHSRNIPGFKSLFAFNTLSLYAFSSVLMTYFGVNYYLSGLHSYAGGEPVPVPAFVYVTVALVVGLTILAYRNRAKQLRIA